MTEEIVVGIDESPASAAALRWAAEHARATGRPLRAIHVLEWPEASDLYATTVVVDYLFTDPEQLEEMYRLASQRAYDDVVPEPGWRLQFAQGHPGRILVQQSRDAALLVVGTREHTGIGRLLNGSVSHYSLSHATCPVAAVPAPPRQPVPPTPEAAATAEALAPTT